MHLNVWPKPARTGHLQTLRRCVRCSDLKCYLILSPSAGFLYLMSVSLICIQALTEYNAELREDPIISTHLTKLYDNLLEQNLIRVIEPFSRVQVMTWFASV